MKTCPVCHARCFEDMDVCYGCLHRFGQGDPVLVEGFDELAECIVEPVVAAFRESGGVSSDGASRSGGERPAAERADGGRCAGEGFVASANNEAAGGLAADSAAEPAERVKATVHPSKGMHGTMVVRIEIPASMFRVSAREPVSEAPRR